MAELTAVLLAGGFGTRIRELYPDVPKPMIPVLGEPFLEWALRYWKRQGVSRFVLSLGHLAEVAERYFAHRPEVATIRETTPLGTGGAVLFAAAEAPLSDPFVLLQSLVAGHMPARPALIGAAIVVLFYVLVGGRAYCAWVCPINPLTDLAAWLRTRLGAPRAVRIDRGVRYAVLAAALAAAAATGSVAWELVNPVSMLHRGLLFGVGIAWLIVLAVFLLDLLFAHRGWCSHLCPVGAFYSLLAVPSPLRVIAARRSECNDCMDCFAVCPEMHVIKPALKGERHGAGPVIRSPNCTNCGRCIDVCSKKVFRFGLRWENK